ncbi:MAG: SRPBCC family protein [Microbacterium sp.]
MTFSELKTREHEVQSLYLGSFRSPAIPRPNISHDREENPMATLRFTTDIPVDVDTAWGVLDRYTRAESRLFDETRPVRMVTVTEAGGAHAPARYRVVTYDGIDVYELDVSIEPDLGRLLYTIPGFGGAVHHQAEIRVVALDDASTRVTWTTDVYPASFLDLYPAELYEANFREMARSLAKGDMNSTV